MRLIKYILGEAGKILSPDETSIYNIIIRDCSEILDVYRKTLKIDKYHWVLWRGSYNDINVFKEFTPRMDRRPKDTAQWLHDLYDKRFKEKFGWNVRSEGVFVTSNKSFAGSFGDPFAFFPLNDFKFVWSKEVDDLTGYLGSGKYDQAKPEEYDIRIMKLMRTYQDDDLEQAIVTTHEIAFKCKEYYLVNANRIHLHKLMDLSKNMDNPDQLKFRFMFKKGDPI